MDIDAKIESPTFTGGFTFTDASIVTRTKTAIVVALTNPAGERLVLTLPNAMLARLGD